MLPPTPTYHYIVLIRLQQILSDLKSTIVLEMSLRLFWMNFLGWIKLQKKKHIKRFELSVVIKLLIRNP